jgi:hypothetical protein
MFIFSFANCSHWFINTYNKGLNGQQAIWAARQYHSHHVLLESLMDDLEQAKLS